MSFQDPIVAGETLVRQAMQSEGFTAGVDGWRVERDGDAEFNDAIIRGTLTVIASDGSMVELDAEAGVPPLALLRYTLGGGNNGQGRLTFVQSGSGINSRNLLRIEAQTDAGTEDTHIDIYSGANGGTHPDGPRIEVNRLVTREAENWTAIPGNNNWTGGSYLLLPDGNVLLDGNLANGTQTSGITVATLPAGYRPRVAGEWMVARNGAFGTSKIRIGTNGVIQLFVNDAVWNAYLSGIIFSTRST